MPCRACIESRKRRKERLERLRQHHAEREAKRQQLNAEAQSKPGNKIVYKGPGEQ